MKAEVTRLISASLSAPMTDDEYADHAACEVLFAAFDPDCGHAVVIETAAAIANLFDQCERSTAAHALALALLPILRPDLFKREGAR
jgi:hypothetical protein